eukprot:m.267934 g.267934  ORF g.267934 m.267934 type:complete len:417 (-) comp17644_c0_seq8:702-1952(-)
MIAIVPYAMLALVVSVRADVDLGGSYRSDHYLDNDEYPENVKPMNPTGGGRMHLILSRFSTTTPQLPLSITFNDEVTIIQDPNQTNIAPFEWIYAQLDRAAPYVWLSFHTQNTSFAASISQVAVHDAANTTIANATLVVPSRDYPLQVTLITTQSHMNEAVVHVHNYGSSAIELNNLTIDSAPVALNDSSTFAPQQHRYYVQALPKPKQEGDVLFVRATTSDGERIGTAARVVKEIFPVEAWGRDQDCPFLAPGANASNFKRLQRTYSIDTVFLGSCCQADPYDIINTASEQGYRVLLDYTLYNTSQITNLDSLAGCFSPMRRTITPQTPCISGNVTCVNGNRTINYQRTLEAILTILAACLAALLTFKARTRIPAVALLISLGRLLRYRFVSPSTICTTRATTTCLCQLGSTRRL